MRDIKAKTDQPQVRVVSHNPHRRTRQVVIVGLWGSATRHQHYDGEAWRGLPLDAHHAERGRERLAALRGWQHRKASGKRWVGYKPKSPRYVRHEELLAGLDDNEREAA